MLPIFNHGANKYSAIRDKQLRDDVEQWWNKVKVRMPEIAFDVKLKTDPNVIEEN